MTDYIGDLKKALIVTQLYGTPAEGTIDQIASVLKKVGIQTYFFSDFCPESNYDEIEKGGRYAKELGVEVVIGYGGGSSMDAAKLIAVAASHPGNLLDYRVGGTREITAATLPVVTIPSTSGTGSHIGRVAVVSENEKKIKRFMASDFLYPRVALCDPQILRAMPKGVTAASGFDAFAQALEGYLSCTENPLGNLCAQEAMRIIAKTLPKVVEDGDNLELRSTMAWADTLQGISLASNAVLTAHVTAMVLGGRYHIPHGKAVASVTVACLRHSRKGAIDKLATVGRLMGGDLSMNNESLADFAIEKIAGLIADIGLDTPLCDYGVKEEDFESIAGEIRQNFAIRLDVDPVSKSVSDLVWILEKSNAT